MSSLNDYGEPLSPPTIPPEEPSRPYGALSTVMKDHLYFLDTGIVFTTPWVKTEALSPRSAQISLTAARKPFEVRIANTTKQYDAVAIKPMVTRGVHAANVQLVVILCGPLHQHFRVFRSIPDPGLQVLDRNAFASLDSALDAVYRGRLTIDEASALFEDVIKITISHLPRAKPADARVERTIELLRENPNRPLDELAAAAGLSYGRMSQLFAETVGISLRSYQLFLKLIKAVRLLPTGRKFTDIAHVAGFTDLAHMSRVFQQSYGAPMSYFMNDNHVQKFRRPEPMGEIR